MDDADRTEPGWAWWAGTRELPLPWEARATVRLRRRGVRLPGPDDPAPGTARMLWVSGWAATLALVGTMVAARALIVLLVGDAPSWYEPMMIAAGLTGIVLTAAAFLSMHHPWLPWALLTAATVPLMAAVAGTATAG